MKKLFVQTYSFLDSPEAACGEDSIRLAAALGYDGIEMIASDMELGAARVSALLAELGLSAVSMHTPGTAEVLDCIEFARQVGLTYLGIAMQPMKDEAAVHAFARRLNEIGAACAKSGLRLFYHNHTQEFAPCGGKYIYDVLMEETDPALVSFELDVGWCAAAGADPLAILRRCGSRIRLIHVKESDTVIGPQPPLDFSEISFDESGTPQFPPEVAASMDRARRINCAACSGLIDWKEIERVCEECAEIDAYIVEREYTPDGFASREAVLRADCKAYKGA